MRLLQRRRQTRRSRTLLAQWHLPSKIFCLVIINFWIVTTENICTYLELPDAIPGYPCSCHSFHPLHPVPICPVHIKSQFQSSYTVPRDPCIEEKLSTPQPTHSTSSANEIVQTNRVILTPSRHPPIAQANASDRPTMACQRPLALPRARIPHLHHTIVRPRDHAKSVCSQSPHSFQMTKESPYTTSCIHIPKSDRRIKTSRYDIPWISRTSRNLC